MDTQSERIIRQNSFKTMESLTSYQGTYRGWVFFTLSLEEMNKSSKLMHCNSTDDIVIMQTLRDMDFSFKIDYGKTYHMCVVGFKKNLTESLSKVQSRFRNFLYRNYIDGRSFENILRDNSDIMTLIHTFEFNSENYPDKFRLYSEFKIEIDDNVLISIDKVVMSPTETSHILSLPMYQFTCDMIDTLIP